MNACSSEYNFIFCMELWPRCVWCVARGEGFAMSRCARTVAKADISVCDLQKGLQRWLARRGTRDLAKTSRLI